MKLLFWISVITIIYVYIGYPVLIYLLSLFYKKPVRGKYVYPTVSVIISAYNEERYMEKKILSLLSLEYPKERMEILIGSDGSTDLTGRIAAKYANEKIRLYRQEGRKGKPSMLNVLAQNATGEILIFTDARQRLDKDAVRELVKYFSDKKVGSVSSALFYENETQNNKTAEGIGLYWKYEKFIRKSESRMGSMLGATGALYAIRRELFPKLPADLILDDIYIPMKIIENGYRAIFDSKAVVYDMVPDGPKSEFLRKARTLAGNYQLFIYLGHLFNPLKGKISWQFFSHKFLRLIVPFLLMVMLASNVAVAKIGTVPVGDSPYFYRIFLWLQIIFYLFAFLGLLLKNKNRIFDIPYMFCIMNTAAVVGLYKFLTGTQGVTWERA